MNLTRLSSLRSWHCPVCTSLFLHLESRNPNTCHMAILHKAFGIVSNLEEAFKLHRYQQIRGVSFWKKESAALRRSPWFLKGKRSLGWEMGSLGKVLGREGTKSSLESPCGLLWVEQKVM